MGLDLTIYEVKNNEDKLQKKYEIEEVLYLSNDVAMLLVNWLYRNDDGKLVGNYLNYHDIYHKIGGYKLVDAYKNLKKVIGASEDKKDVYALFYFPCLYTIDDWVSSVEMFSEAYYRDLEYLYEALDKFLFGEDSISPTNRLFVYNISW